MKEKENSEKAYSLFNQYVNGEYSSIRKFVKETEYPHSVVALTKLWKRYVKEYQTEWGKSFQCSVVDR